MPIRAVRTDIPVVSGSVGGATFEGRRWVVSPHVPIPLDGTTQAAAYIAANKDKTKNVAVWRIRFGKTPTGDLRFKPCQIYVYPPGLHAAYGPGQPPYQRYATELAKVGRPEFGEPDVGDYDWIGMGTQETEDCLWLTIFAPEGATGRQVNFHISGGAWGVYHQDGPQQLGHRLAAHKGSVVVLPGYRRSIFGHFPHPDLIEDNEPSVAYTDIKKALEWVHNNIAAFGGDPAQVGISGTSAGGAAVQLLLADDDTQTWFRAALIGSGGGTARYLPASYYTKRSMKDEMAIRAASPVLFSQHPDYRTLKQAIDAMGFAWAMQHAARVETLQGLHDARTTVSADSVAAAQAGGSLVLMETATDNVYPFQRSDDYSAVEAAKSGKFRKPFVSLFAECEALNLLGDDYVSLRTALLALSTATLNGWAQRLGYADYEGWKAGAWMPVGGLESLSSSQYKTAVDPLCVDCENRRVLYTHAVFGYAAWRVARAAIETGSATSYLACNNFSANSIWAGHSQEVALMMNNVEWVVAGGGEYPDATVPGLYVNNRMDAFYVSEFMMQMLAALAATGNPNGPFSYAGFDLFADPATHPADGGQFTATWHEYEIANPGHMNVIGKYFDPLDNLNAGTFGPGGDIVAGLDIQRDARVRYVEYMEAAMLEYLSLLEP